MVIRLDNSCDAVVIGGGVIGCAIARAFSIKGLKVAVIERDGVAANASGFAWGGLAANYGAGVPGMMLPIYKRAIARHLELYDELRDYTSLDWQLARVVSMTLASDAAALQELNQKVRWMKSEGFDAELIDADDIYRMEPAIAPGMTGASVSRSQWELDSMTYSLALAEDAEKHGACFVNGKAMQALESGGRISGVVLADGDRYSAPIVIAATGPWGSGIRGIPELPIHPVKGEILRIECPGDDLQHRVSFNGRNVGRKPDGLVWAGTYEWERGYDRSTTREGIEHILSGVSEYLPSLASMPIRSSTACLRPVSSDGLPIIGPAGGIDGLYVANGAGNKGVLLSPVIAEMMVGIALDGERPPLELSTERFVLD